MKAVEINKTGGPEVLEIKDISLDKPGHDQVTIEQKAIGLNYIDTYHRSGLYPVDLPTGLGLEGAGIITTVGEKYHKLLYVHPFEFHLIHCYFPYEPFREYDKDRIQHAPLYRFLRLQAILRTHFE